MPDVWYLRDVPDHICVVPGLVKVPCDNLMGVKPSMRLQVWTGKENRSGFLLLEDVVEKLNQDQKYSVLSTQRMLRAGYELAYEITDGSVKVSQWVDHKDNPAFTVRHTPEAQGPGTQTELVVSTWRSLA